MLQINAHYSATAKPEMTIEKLQKVASAQVEPEFKAKWLRWWNSGSMRRAAYRFPPAGFKEADLDLWLNKATFWAQVIQHPKNHSYPSFVVGFLFSSRFIIPHLSNFPHCLSFFLSQLEDSLIRQFNEISGDDLGEIDWKASGGIMKPSEYVESWRILLWDKAFLPFLHPAANPPFLKGSTFDTHPGAPLAENRVLYRYFPTSILFF